MDFHKFSDPNYVSPSLKALFKEMSVSVNYIADKPSTAKETLKDSFKGNEIYRRIIFTTGTSLVECSSLRLPSWGCYTLDGKDIEFNGVLPDKKVLNNFDDKMNGRDPQLDKAIELILGKLKK